MNTLDCRTLARQALEEQGSGNSALGAAKRATIEGAEAEKIANLKLKASDHHTSAEKLWVNARTEAKKATSEECASCLGILGVELCPLLSEVEVSIPSLYQKLGEKRGRVKHALKGEVASRSASDLEIAQIIGTAISDIDEADYFERIEEQPTGCAHKQDPHLFTPLLQELKRGADPEVLSQIGLGNETPRSLSGGRLSSDEPMAEYLDPEDPRLNIAS